MEVPGGLDLLETAEQGPPGPPGAPGPASGAGAQYTAAAALSGHRVLALDAAGQAVYASADDAAHMLRVAGLSLGAAALGEDITVQSAGLVVHAGWTFTPGAIVYLGLAGALVQAVPEGAAFTLVLGRALSATQLLLSPQPPVAVAP